MPSGGGGLHRQAQTEGGAAEEGALDEASARGGLAKRADAVQRPFGKRRKDPMPSGGSKIHHRGHRGHRGEGTARWARGGALHTRPLWPLCALWLIFPAGVLAHWGIRRKHPMPSGAACLQPDDERVHPAAMGGAGATQGDDLGRVKAVGATGGGATGPPLGRARPGAEPAMHPATTVLHGRLTATFAPAGPGATAWRGQEVAGCRTVPEPAATVGRQVSGGGRGVRDHGGLPGSSSLQVRWMF
jgi:hypothetical protein